MPPQWLLELQKDGLSRTRARRMTEFALGSAQPTVETLPLAVGPEALGREVGRLGRVGGAVFVLCGLIFRPVYPSFRISPVTSTHVPGEALLWYAILMQPVMIG